MRKLECNRCGIYCKLEIDEENPIPTNCVYNGRANWQEINEEKKGIEKNIPTWINESIVKEYSWACYKHPNFPCNEFEMMCIIQEDLSKAFLVLNNVQHCDKGCMTDVYIELLHTIVTCIRILEEMDKKCKLERVKENDK